MRWVFSVTAGLVPSLSQDCTGNYSDLGVLGGGHVLNPEFSVLTDTTGYPASNIAGDPDLLQDYCNGGRTPLGTSGPMQALPAVDEGGATWIDVRYGPLQTAGDYHIGAASSGLGNGSSNKAPDHDFDNQVRPQSGYDRGADEFQAP